MIHPQLAAWVAALSVVAFVLAAFDKWRARRGGSRVPERRLLLVALAGGSPGLVLAMLLVRHKTRKGSFLARLALVIALQAALVVAALVLTGGRALAAAPGPAG